MAAVPGRLMVWSDFRLCPLPRRLMNFESLRNVIMCMYVVSSVCRELKSSFDLCRSIHLAKT